MSEHSVFDELCRRRSSARSRSAAAEQKKAIIQAKVNRLKKAKQELGQCYSDFETVKRSVKNGVEDCYVWKGDRYNRFTSFGDSLISSNKGYYSNIDYVRDAVNLEISNLENEIYRQEDIIGDLHAVINSLTHRIENFFN